MIAPSGVVTLTSDFGIQDSYVGTMKGVILRIYPAAKLVDLTHQVSPQDVLEASLVLEGAYRYFPEGTVHLTVVDPGVGTSRRAILLQAGPFYFVGPDNGIFTRVLGSEPEARVFAIENPHYRLSQISDTFHGRDIIAPVAAYLAQGIDPAEFGPQITDPVLLPLPLPRRWGNQIQGEVVSIDGFGNVITNVSRRLLDDAAVAGGFGSRSTERRSSRSTAPTRTPTSAGSSPFSAAPTSSRSRWPADEPIDAWASARATRS